MDNILNNIGDSCYGCGMCVTVCKKDAIKLTLNENGFYMPILVNAYNCSNCGLCQMVCSLTKKEPCVIETPKYAFAAWSNDPEVRNMSSSGGVGYELSKYLISKGYKTCQVKYNPETNRAEHYITDNIDNLLAGVGSKYIQSYTVDAFKNIDKKQKYLVVGTPCQIDSFRRYAQLFRCEDNFLFMDFFCHGVPSMNLWEKYLNGVERKIGKSISAFWRDKKTGWHDSWTMVIEGARGKIHSPWTKGDVFYRMFLEHHCLNMSCHEDCKYKKYSSSADIRIGDFWGETYSKEDTGVTSVICFSERGKESLCNSNLTLIEHTPENVCEGQMATNAHKSVLRSVFMKALESPYTTLTTIKILLSVEWLRRFPSRVVNKIKRMI